MQLAGNSSIVSFLLLLICINSSAGQTVFKRGAYYDQDGNRKAGFVAIQLDPEKFLGSKRDKSNSYILFKSDSLADPIKIRANNLKAFTILIDSFAVLRKYQVYHDNYLVDVPIGFCKVIVANGKVILYSNAYTEYMRKYYAGYGGYMYAGPQWKETTNTFLVQQRGGAIIFVQPATGDFVKQMSLYFKISDVIVAKIKNGEYSHATTETLVRDFNAWFEENKKSRVHETSKDQR